MYKKKGVVMLTWEKDWIYRIIMLLCCVFVPVSTLDAQKYTADNWRQLDIRQVKVNGEIGRRVDITINNNVLVLDADRDFLRPFQDKKLEEGYIGLGKFIDSVVRFAAYSNTSNLLEFKKHIISETIKTQEEDGYIGILASEYRMWNLWDIHEMGYLILGLTNNYKYFKEEESLKAAEKLAQYIMNQWSDSPNRITNSWVSVNVTTTGLEEAMLALYGQTNKQQYLDFCVKDRKLPEWNAGIIEGRWGNLEGHAYHYLCRCLAQLQLYNIQPDSGLLVNSQKAMDFLIRQDGLLIPGLCGYHECWHSNQQGFFKLGETCATAYMLRWLNTLLQMKGESQYGDIMERIIYNGLFAAQSPDGRRIRYYSPFEGERVYFDGDTYCCPCNYRRIIAELPGMIYYRWNEGLAINLYTESTASFNLKKDITLDVRQETDYPNSGKVVIYINPNNTTEFPLRLRIPGWCNKASISINGESIDVEKQGDSSYITLNKKWHKGDKVELEMAMPFRLVKGRKTQSGRVAVMRGPQLFCLNPDRQENFNPGIMRLLYIDPTSLELSDVDSSIRPQGLTCQAYCWDPNDYNAQSKAPIKLLLTEYADPGCQATYFLVRNPNSDIFVDDELFESSFTTVYATGDSTFLDKSLTRDAMLRLKKETQKPEPGGFELANIFLKDLVENGPVEINAFDIVEQFEKESFVIDNLMNNKVSLLGGYDPQDVGSPVNWYHTPKGDLQWPTHLSRHQWLNPLARAWRVTKDPVYSQKIVDILLDWIEKNTIGNDGLTWGSDEPGTINKGGVASEGFFKNYVDGPWTSLSAHSRLHSWTYLLVMIHDSPQMTNRNVSIIFNSLSNDHRKSMIYHPRRMNQYIAIATSMVNLSWYYPFLKGSSEAGEMGLERVQHFALTEIYPDGSMAECSPNYAKGSLERVHKVVRQDQLQGGKLFQELDDKICKAMRYFYLSSDPQGNSPRIAKGGNSVLPLIEKLGTNCNDPQIQYLYSKGAEGQEPGFLSKAYNWAGHIIFRSDWSEDASWLFFEPGPRGSGHADVATLNLQLQSKGEWLLTDPGYFSYSTAGEDGEMAKYMRSTAAHNLALVDKQNQIYYEWGKGRAYNSKPGKYNWSDNGKIAYAEGSYDFGFGEKGKVKVTHKRQITYNREQDKFIIKDIFEGNGDHQIDLHWQLPPTAEFKKDESNFSVTNGRAAARFSIACNKSFSIESAKGSKSPFSGWFSLHYGELEPSITVKVLTEGKLPITLTTEIDID